MQLWQIVILGVLILEVVRECWVVWGVSRPAEQAAKRGDWQSACAALEKQAAMKAPLFGFLHPFKAHYRMGQLYTLGQRYEDAVRHWQILLERYAKAPSVIADIRLRLADCLEGCGRDAEAGAQRNQAQQDLAASPGRDFLALLAHAKALETERRYVDACTVLDQALPLATGIFQSSRIQVLVRLANAAWNAGCMDDSLRYAETALAEQPQDKMMRALSHKSAALCYSSRNDLDACEFHRAAALELITKLGDEEQRLQSTGELAETKARRGRIDEALAMVQSNARPGQPLPVGLAAVSHMCLMSQGKFDEARRVLEEMRQNIPFVPHLKRRLDAAILMDMARSEAQAGRGPEAWPMLCEAEAELMREPRLGVRFMGAQSWLLALRGEYEAAREKSAAAEEALANYRDDPETIRTVRSDLARAAFAWGDFELARSGWERYLETRPAPLYWPMAHCYLGNCYEALGDTNTARTAYSKALETGIETYYTRQARERLAALVPA